MSEVGYKKPPVEKQFQPGNRGNPGGKPVGARNRLQGRFLNDLAADFDEHGKRAIVAMREADPSGYVRAVASLMPKELEVTRAMNEIDDDQLDAAILAVRTILAAADPRGGAFEEKRGKQAEDVQPVREAERVP